MSSDASALVPLLCVLVAIACRRSNAARGVALTWRQQILFGPAISAVVFPTLGLAAAARGQAQPAPNEWPGLVGLLVAVGLIPLAVFMAFDVPLRFVRRWELSRGV